MGRPRRAICRLQAAALMAVFVAMGGEALAAPDCKADAPNSEQVRRAVAAALRAPLSTIPERVVSVSRFGACPNDEAPDAAAIEEAANQADNVLLFFPPGRYVQDKSVRIRRSRVILFGPDAMLDAIKAADYALALMGDGASAVGLDLRLGAGGGRTSGEATVRILASGAGNRIVGNTVRGSRGAAIALFGATDFQVLRNVVSDTAADGIHMTRGSSGGLVEGNTVSRTGDDLIAVVSYRQKRGERTVGAVHDVVIRKNTLGPNSWGRGVAVIGGRNITISDNIIVGNAAGAGIMIAQEKSYGTFGVRDVIVERNVIEDNQTGPAPRGRAGGSAIQVNGAIAGADEGVRNVTIRNNTVRRAKYRLFSARGNVCGIVVDTLSSDAANTLSRNEGEARCEKE